MPHYRCVPCGIRFATGGAHDRDAEPCHECGGMLDPVDDLRTIVGYPLAAQKSSRAQQDGAGFDEDRLSRAIAAAVVPPSGS
jgi:hypothetical protein